MLNYVQVHLKCIETYVFVLYESYAVCSGL